MPQQCTRVKIYDPDGTEFFYECKSNVAFQGHIRHLFENLIEFSQSFQSSTLRLISDTNGLISSHYGLQEASSGHWIEDVNDSKFQKEDNILFFKLRPLSRYISDVESLLPPPTNTTTTTTISPPTNINNNNNSNISTPNSSTPNSQPSSLRSHIESQIQTQFKMRTTTLVNSNLTSTNATNNNTTTQNNNNNNSKSNKKALRKAIESLHIHLTLLMLKERTRNDHVYISSDNLVKIIRIIFRSPTLWAINLLVGYLQRNNSFSTSASNINDNGNTILKSITNTMLTTTITTTTTDISPSATINRTFSKSTGRTNTLTSSSVQTSNSSSSSSNNNNSINNSSNSNGNSNGNTSNQFSNRDSLGHQDSSGNQISLFTLIDQSIKTCSSEFKKNFYLYLMEQYDQRRDSILDTVDAAVDTDANDDDDLYFNKAIRASASVQSLSSSLLSIPNLHSEIIIQTISMINNIYLLSPNPVNYIIRLHKDNIFRSLYELKIKDNLISDSIQYKTLRKYLVNELKDQCLESIDTERIQHQILFSDLWSSTLTLYPYGGCSSYKWLLLGFRGANPSDDLNCTGVIALRNLNYFAKQHTSLFKYLLTIQTDRELCQDKDDCDNSDNSDNTLVDCQMLSKSYPVALVGISLSYLLSKAYGFRLNKDNNNNNNDSINNNSGSSNSVNEDNNNNNNNNNNDDGKSEIVEEDPSEKWDIVFSDYNWLDECYVSTFILFESLWSFQSISYSDFSTILSTTESIITKTIEKKPVNSQEFTEYIVGCLLESTEVTNAIDVVHRFNQLLSNDTSITDIAYSCHSLIRFFGESLDSLTYQFLPPNLVKSKSDSLQERNNRIETFIGEWLDSEQVDYGEKIRFSVQIQESLLTASLKNNSNNNNNNYANGGGIVNSPLKNVQNSLNGSGGVSLRSSNSSNNQNGSNTNTDPVVESRINKLNKFFGEMIHPSQLGSSTDSSPSVVSTSPNPPTSTTSTTLATLPPATTTTTNNKNNNNNTHDTSTTTTAKNNHQTSKNESLEEDQIKPKSPEEKSIDKVQRLLGVDLQKANISFSKLHKMQQPPSPPNELLPAQPIQLNQSQQQQQQKQSPVPISSVVVSTSPNSASSTSPTSNSPSPTNHKAAIDKAWRKGTMTTSKSNYHASVMIPLSSPSTSPNGGNDVHHSTSTSPNNNDDSDHVNSNNNQTALTLPDVTKSSLLNESVDNNPPSCRASINSSLETLDVISDQSSVVDEDDKLHVFYQERFDMETPPSSLHQQIQQQLQQQQHQHQQVPDLQLETTTSTTNDKEIMVENVTDALLLQQLDDSLESPIIIPETKPVERASVSIPSLELNNSNNNINNSKLKPSLPPRNPDLTVVSEATISDSPRVSPIKPVVNKPSPFVATAINNNNNNNTTPTRPTAKPIAKSMPTSPINQSPTLTSANSTPTNTTPRSTSPSTVVASKTVQIGGPDSPIKVSLRKTSAPLPSNNNNNSAPNSLQSPSSGASNDSPRKEQGAPSQVRPRAQTSKAPPELKKSHTVNSLSDPKLIATNDHSPSVSSLISVFGEKIQRRG